MRYAGLGGSTVPAAVTRRLDGLGMFVFRSYGSTEHPSITGSAHDAPRDKRLYTDGNARPGVEIRLADDGEILRGAPDLCLGYTDDALTAKAFDDDGWYRTGDVGVLDEDGYLTITDRKADVIIRGGENISALEVEEVLLAMPGVAEAVVVAAPDDRLGERAAAVLRMQPGAELPSLDEVRAHFEPGASPARSGPSTARSRRLPTHRERQGAEVRGARGRPARALPRRRWENRILTNGKECSMASLSARSTSRFRCSTRTTTSTSRRRR